MIVADEDREGARSLQRLRRKDRRARVAAGRELVSNALSGRPRGGRGERGPA